MKSKIRFQPIDIDYRIVFLMITVVIFIQGSLVSKDNRDRKVIAGKSDVQPVEWIDGQYIGESKDYTGMKVRVLINEGELDSIIVLEAFGDFEYYQTVIDSLPNRMIAEGTADVEGITGATLSSRSLIKAVKAALDKAVVKSK